MANKSQEIANEIIENLEESEVKEGNSDLIALRGTMHIDAHDYVMQVSSATKQDKGIILECAVMAFKALSSEQKMKILSEVLAKRMSF